MNKNVFFFIGTEAELIKVFPVIIECQRRGCVCNIIASGQNDLKKNRILNYISLKGRYIELSQETMIRKSIAGLFTWFMNTSMKAKNIILQNFSFEEISDMPLVVHGDTVSTFMGALIGWQLHMITCHVEAGLRSHHLLNPFPEEIDRVLTSKIAKVHFAPGIVAINNLVNTKGKIINTQYNTSIDSLAVAKTMPIVTELLEHILSSDYFIFVMHRQENLMKKKFVRKIMACVEQLSEQMKCVLILHKITEKTLSELGILTRLQSNSNFILYHRIDYFDFMKILDSAKYVITDGGSNQEELYYMGKPCLIMRKRTERQEGLNQNARMFNGDEKEVLEFGNEYKKMCIDPIVPECSPSDIIAKFISSLS